MVPLYILGLLGRFGPQHGYQIKKLVEEQLADFTQIKLPTIYYHLEKLEAAGLIDARAGKDGARPEKTVYSITDAGQAHFAGLLRETLDMRYRPIFEADAAFYFSDHLSGGEILDSLSQYLDKLTVSLEHIEAHRRETLPYLPGEMRRSADIIFEHHAAHYRAEMEWAEMAMRTIQRLPEEGEENDEDKSD